MKISIFGLGYVGTVSAGCLAKDGHTLIGVDPNKTKVDLINSGCTPIIENEIGDIIEKASKEGKLRATTSGIEAVHCTDLSIICVGTPSGDAGQLDLCYVRRVCEEIGAALREKEEPHTIAIRSTMLPGSTRDVVIPALEEFSGKKVGEGFDVCYNPEFLRESTAVYDFFNPPKIVIGELYEGGGEKLVKIYSKLKAPLVRTTVEVAEMVKYSDNVWHALKVGFANEIGLVCKSMGLDSHKVMDIFCQDKKLNLSSYYLKPGFAFGGSCLPKDVRALVREGRTLDLDIPILNSILPSNELHILHGLKLIMDKGNRKIGILGFSFKAGTDDLRESPVVEVIERLLGKGYDIKVYDRNVRSASLIGANRDYILNHIPHIFQLMVDNIEELIEHAETIVIGNNSEEFNSVLEKLRENQVVVDFVRIPVTEKYVGKYDGICW